jgi:hypothetical protein
MHQQVEITVQSPIPQSLVTDNVAATFLRGGKRFHRMDVITNPRERGPVALVGGGPSLNDQMAELEGFDGTIIVCGSAGGCLLDADVIPDYWCVCDPDPVMAKFVRPHKGVTYLIASQCHPDVFAALEGCDVRIWHATVNLIDTGKSIADFHDEPTVDGGNYVILRAWPMARIMGHTDFHFFGFDCSFPLGCESQHAYDYCHDKEDPIGAEVYATGERFITTPGWVAQLDEFMRVLRCMRGTFSVTVHGKSLAASSFYAEIGGRGREGDIGSRSATSGEN